MKKKTIRQNVFETNSSSSHSVTIVNGGRDQIVKHDTNKPFILDTGDFGWKVTRYSDFDSKLRYAYTLTKELKDDQYLDMLKKVLKENIDNIREFEEGYDDGYVDHQSLDMADEIFHSKETLESFLFCKQSYFNTDNDNH